MNRTIKSFRTATDLLHDVFLCVALYCFVTGLLPFAAAAFYNLADSKPWLHRLLITGIIFTAVVWGLLRYFWAERTANLHTPLIQKIRKTAIPAQTIVWGMFVFSALLWSGAAIARHQAFQSGFDSAIFSQAVWNTGRGSFLYSSIKGGICLLGDHFSPLLALFAVPYALFPKPECLFILQAVLAAGSVFPLYALAKNKIGENAGSLIVVFALICYLPLRNAVRFEFHPEVAALPLFFWAYYFWDRSRLYLCSFFLILALLSKENVALVTFAFGFYALCKRQIWFGLIWMIFSGGYFLLVTQLWIPQLSGQSYAYLAGNYLSWNQTGFFAFLKHVLSPQSFFYLVKIFLPLGFLPFGDWAIILTLPGLAQNLVSQNEMTRSIFFQYTATLTPFAFIALVESLKKKTSQRTGVWIYLTVCTLLTAGVSDFYIMQRSRQQRTAHMREIAGYFKNIPAEASVRTHEMFAAHLANRKEIHIYENHHPREGGSPAALQADYWVLDRFLLSPEFSMPSNYTLGFEKDGFMILKRKSNV